MDSKPAPISDNSIHQAVEIAKVAVAAQNGNSIGHGDAVAEFIETVARKIEELKVPRRSS